MGETQEKTEKLRINKAKDKAASAVLNAKENGEKKLEQDKTEAESTAQQEVAVQQEEQKKTEELSRKQIDKVKKDAAAKTEAAEKEADTLKNTLMKFMQHAHDKLFSAEAQEKDAADKKASEVMSEAEGTGGSDSSSACHGGQT